MKITVDVSKYFVACRALRKAVELMEDGPEREWIKFIEVGHRDMIDETKVTHADDGRHLIEVVNETSI